MAIGERFLVAGAEPDGDVGGFQGVVDDAGQVGTAQRGEQRGGGQRFRWDDRR